MLKSFRDYLESFLTFYCKKKNIKYKQGMNEIMGPFLFIKANFNISLSKLYNLSSCFIDKFLTNYYNDDEFYSLQSSLGGVQILLKYHQPILYNIFEKFVITPDLYATSWILTLFSK